MTSRRLVKYVVAGQIRDEYIIDTSGKANNGILGGSLLYTAAAVRQWGGQTGILGVVGSNFPQDRIKALEEKEIDIRGIKIIPETMEMIDFYAYPNEKTCLRENPVAVYAASYLQVPKELLSFAFPGKAPQRENQLIDTTIFMEDIPLDYLDSSAAHICPLDITSQIQLSTLLQKGAIRTLTVQPHHAYMVPDHFDDIAILIKDTSAVIVNETEIRLLFQSRTDDLWEMLKQLCDYGCRAAIVRNNQKGYSCYERISEKRYRVPEYPVHKLDPTGEMDVFCGAFLTAFHESNDLLHAVSLASAAASIKAEGTGPFSISNCLPGLEIARAAVLQNMATRY